MPRIKYSIASIAFLVAVILMVHGSPARGGTCLDALEELTQTIFVSHPEIKRLHEVAKDGVTIIISPLSFDAKTKYEKPTAEQMERWRVLFGADIKYVDDAHAPAAPKKLKGLVIHIGDVESLAKHYFGDANPLISEAENYRQIESNKWLEYKFITSVDSRLIPESKNLLDILNRDPESKGRFDVRRQDAKAAMQGYLASDRHSLNQDEFNVLLRLTRDTLDVIKREYPEGAFVKNVSEAGTADSDQLIRSEKISADEIVSEMHHALYNVKLDVKKDNAVDGEAVRKSFKSYDSTFANFVFNTVIDPSNVMAQKTVKIAKTRDGYGYEVRIDFVQGVAVNGNIRWGFDYQPEITIRAAETVNDFFAKAPENLRKLTGGADVALLENGEMIILEFNPGAQSGFIDPRDSMFQGNEYIRNLSGRESPLLRQMGNLASADIKTKIDALKDAKVSDPFWQDYNKSLDDKSFLESVFYLRNRMLDQWFVNPSREDGRTLLAELRAVIESRKTKIRSADVKNDLRSIEKVTAQIVKERGR